MAAPTFKAVNMMQPVPFVERSARRARSATKPMARVGALVNARIVWTLCALALGSAGVVAWKVQEPARETVMLSPQSLPQGASASSLGQFPGLVSASSLPSAVPLANAPAALVSAPAAPAAQNAELNQARAESAAVTAGASSVPTSTWPVVTHVSNGVAPRSDMRYRVNPAPQR